MSTNVVTKGIGSMWHNIENRIRGVGAYITLMLSVCLFTVISSQHLLAETPAEFKPDGNWLATVQKNAVGSSVFIWSHCIGGVLLCLTLIGVLFAPFDASAQGSIGTGALSQTGTIATGAWPRGMAISADGTNVYVTNHDSRNLSIFTRNTSTGALSGTSTIATGYNPRGIAVSADGANVYVANYSDNNLSIFTRNTSTGALSGTSTIATGSSPLLVAVSADGANVYVTNNSGTISIFTRNTSNGALSGTSTIATVNFPFGMIVPADGNNVYVVGSNSISLFLRNTSTGALSTIYTLGSGGGFSYGHSRFRRR